MIIKVLGSGCANCQKLDAIAHQATERLGIEAEFFKVTDFAEIMAYGVMSTPALVVDEKLALAGRVPSIDEVMAVLERAGA
jgi:small redox-active disulfide protein 2